MSPRATPLRAGLRHPWPRMRYPLASNALPLASNALPQARNALPQASDVLPQVSDILPPVSDAVAGVSCARAERWVRVASSSGTARRMLAIVKRIRGASKYGRNGTGDCFSHT